MQYKKDKKNTHSPRTIIIVPCYNEAKRMHPAIFLKFLQKTSNVEFIFVNDGSRDTTQQMLERLHDNMKDRTTIMQLKTNSGKEEAVRTGLIYALEQKPDFVGYWDADLACPLTELPAMLNVIKSNNELQCVYGARIKLLGHKVKRTLLRRSISICCRILAQSALDLPVTDTQCGAKVFRATPQLNDAIRSPFTARWLFDVELFARLKIAWNQYNPGLYEHPLSEWQEISGSNVSILEMLGAGFTMLGLIVRMRMGLFKPPQIVMNSDYDIYHIPSNHALNRVA